MGVLREAQGKTDEAVGLYRKAIELDPAYAEAHNNLSGVLVRQGQLEAALAQAAEAQRLAPDLAAPHLNAGNALYLQKNLPAAAAAYSRAIQINPDLAEAHQNLAVALEKLGQFDQAVGQYGELARRRPDYAEAYVRWASALARLGRIEEAINRYHEALRLNNTLLPALEDLAWLLATCPEAKFRNGADALRLAARAVELTEQKDPAALDVMAAAQAASGQFTEAVATAQRAADLALALQQPALADAIQTRLRSYQQAESPGPPAKLQP